MSALKQIFAILNLTRGRHIVRAITSPKHTIKAIKYHYRRVPERIFVEFIAQEWGYSTKDVDLIYANHAHNQTVWEEIKSKLAICPNSYASQMTKELSTLYLLVKLLKPDCIIETGVSSGASSAYILQALHDNGKGELHSIDLPPDNLPEDKMSGWVVPSHLKNQWNLHIGDSKDLLEPVLANLGQVDCFLHDSLHTYDHMIWEFRTVWNYLTQGGLFLSHDVGANDAFLDFMKEKSIPWKDYRVFHVLGGLRKMS